MTAFNTDPFLELWEQSDQVSERKLQKYLLTGLDTIVQAENDTLKKMSVGPPIYNPVVRWMEEWGYPSTITGQLATTTLTISGNLFGAAVTANSISKVIRVGTILERESSLVQLKVTAVTGIADGAPFTCTVEAYGNTSLSDDTDPVDYTIIGEVWSDYKDADHSRVLDRSFREVGTQIHAQIFEIAKTRKNTRYEVVPNETEHQIAALLRKMRQDMAYSVLRGRPKYDSGYVYGNKTEEPTMCGLRTWPAILQGELANTNVYVNASGADVSKTYLDNLVRNMMLTEHSNFNAGDWWIICHPLQHANICDFDVQYRRKTEDSNKAGFSVDIFDSKIGKSFPILPDRYMRQDEVMVVDLSKASYGYYNDDQLDRKELATQGRYERWLISFQTYGVVLRNARQSVGMIYGLSTS